MEKNITVTYYQHSGFSCAMGDVLLVFDYWRGRGITLPAEAELTEEKLQRYRQVVVFISHSHSDHLDRVVYRWEALGHVNYVISHELPGDCKGHRMKPGDTLRLSEKLTVRAYDSTDLGISFLVELDGFTIFHAGDLNLWHWREESSLRQIEIAEQLFCQACEPLKQEQIDLAFFPVDPRQGRMFDAGANYFMMLAKPRLMIPMHFWDRSEIAVEYAKRSRCKDTEVVAMTRPGQTIRLEIDEQGFMTIHMLSVPRPLPEESTRGVTRVSLDGYEGKDPFLNTDLPIKLDE